MNRRTSEEWIIEQGKDRSDMAPITLEIMESPVRMNSISEMLVYESGRADYRRMSDIDVCAVIDMIAVNDFHKESIYLLSQDEKSRIADHLRQKYHLGRAQICRCLALKVKK